MRSHLGFGIAAAIIAAGARAHAYTGSYIYGGFRMEEERPPVLMKPATKLDLTGALDPKPKGKRGRRRKK